MKNGRFEEFGNTYWYQDGKLHREDGPAAEYPIGMKIWYLHGKLHREDGPAKEYAGGDRATKEWWLNGVEFSEEQFMQWLDKKHLNEKLHATLPPKHKEKKKKI